MRIHNIWDRNLCQDSCFLYGEIQLHKSKILLSKKASSKNDMSFPIDPTAPRFLTLRDVSIQKPASRISQLSITQNDIILQDTNL